MKKFYDSKSEVLTPDPINRPSEAALQPADNAVVGDPGVSFDWDDVSDPGALFYDLAHYDKEYN